MGSELAGCSEFPGGKVHPGETPEACACRECLEETLLEVTAVELLLRRTFTYPHGTFDLHFWLCRPTSDGAVQDTHNGFRWVTNAELATLTFPGGNAPVVGLLTVNCTTS